MHTTHKFLQGNMRIRKPLRRLEKEAKGKVKTERTKIKAEKNHLVGGVT